jgi:hypothetical protein
MILKESGKMGLKIPRSQGHLGSIPSSGTIIKTRVCGFSILCKPFLFFSTFPFCPAIVPLFKISIKKRREKIPSLFAPPKKK